MRTHCGAALVAALACAGALPAQTPSTSELSGRVVAAEGARPVFGATIRLMQGSTVRETRSGTDGRYRLTGMTDGSWVFSVQAVGYRRAVGRVEFVGPRMEREFAIERLPTQLDSVIVASRWSGIRLVVGDAVALSAIAGAKVRVVVPKDTTLLTDSVGRTDIERPSGTDLTLVVERAGFARRVVQAKVPERGALELVVTLDSAGPPINNEMQWQDMMARLRMSGPRGVAIGREELLATGARGLKEATRSSPSFVRAVAVLARDACLFIDGVPKPGMPAEALNVEDIDFVELYPPGSDNSRTLALRWPPGGECGAAIGSAEERFLDDDKVQYVVVWMRQRRRTP